MLHWKQATYLIFQKRINFYTHCAEILKNVPIILQIAIYLKPFKLDVWLLILATIPFGGLVVFSITRLSPALQWKKARMEFEVFTNSILFSFGALFAQGKCHFVDYKLKRFENVRFIS